MLVMKHKSFEDPQVLTLSRSKSIERVREAAESFINSIGAEKVVSVTEGLEASVVTVWFRDGGYIPSSKDVMPEL